MRKVLPTINTLTAIVGLGCLLVELHQLRTDNLLSSVRKLHNNTELSAQHFIASIKNDTELSLAIGRKDEPSPLRLPVLADWEQNSVSKDRSCQPPPGVPRYCCLGSIAMLGGQVQYNPQWCQLNLTAFDLTTYTSSFVSASGEESGDDCDDACAIVDHLLKKNWTLAFVGDSITRQSFAGLECALHKAGLNVERTFSKKDKSYVRAKLSPGQEFWQYGLRDITKLRITRNGHAGKAAIIRYYSMYRPLDDMSEMVDIFKQNQDVVVFDFGLHYKPATEMELFATLMQRLVSIHPQPKLLVWRETTSQHFDTPYGHYDDRDGVMQNDLCAELPANETFGVRKQMVENTLGSLVSEFDTWVPGKLLVLPYREFTAGLHSLHNPIKMEKKTHFQDCTHFCHTPFLWVPIWNGLRLGMDKFIASS